MEESSVQVNILNCMDNVEELHYHDWDKKYDFEKGMED